jgi:uncharacterized membrane protein YdfJ with MMPL/SSD domain
MISTTTGFPTATDVVGSGVSTAANNLGTGLFSVTSAFGAGMPLFAHIPSLIVTLHPSLPRLRVMSAHR